MDPGISLILIIVGCVVAFFLLLYLLPVNLWFTAQLSNVKISLLNLVLMRLRKVSPALVTNAMITSTKAGLRITTNEIETHYLAGGNVNKVIKALISLIKPIYRWILSWLRQLIWLGVMYSMLYSFRSIHR